MRGILSLLGPALILALAVYFEPSVRALDPADAALARFGPIGIFIAGLLFALRFHRTRVFFGLLTLALAHAALLTGLGGADVSAAVAVLVPLDLIAFALLSERGVFTQGGVTRFLLLAIEVAAIARLAASPSPDVSDALGHAFFPREAIHAVTRIPQPALLAGNLAAIVLLARHMARPSADTGAFVGALATAVLAFHAARGGGDATAGPAGLHVAGLYLGAGGLMLVLAVVEQSYQMAFLDELTGLPGRRALGERLRQLGSSYTVAMVDIDHFKKFNDTYGHDIGDDCLRMVAGKLAQVGGGGEAFRYGGEEFSVVFPGRKVDDALPTLEALRATIEKAPFRPHRKDEGWNPFSTAKAKTVHVTVSIGAAGPEAGNKDPWVTIKTADDALYQAKKAGRNRVAS